ncbi:hypothetical protein F5880DRAFT_1661506 [Lentinula raphanica]|nr:hypothetical protein F5880DRAFT_1661506 [Lentinula raphanica]
MDAERKDNIEHLFGARLKIHYSKRTDTANAAGIAIVLNKQLISAERVQTHTIVDGHALLLETTWHREEKIVILAIYAPNQTVADNVAFWTQISDFFTRNPRIPKPDMMAGDFNMVEEEIDRLPMGSDRAQAQSFEDLKVQLQLADGWRQTYPTRKAYTYMQNRPGGLRSHARLDRIYIKPPMETNTFEWRIQSPGLSTDHSLVSVRLTCDSAPTIGKGRWCWPRHIIKGIALQEKLDDLENQPNNRFSAQTLWASFQDSIAEEARKRAKIIIPKLEKQIRETEASLHLIEEDAILSDEERSLSITLLSEKLAELENRRHQSTREARMRWIR